MAAAEHTISPCPIAGHGSTCTDPARPFDNCRCILRIVILIHLVEQLTRYTFGILRETLPFPPIFTKGAHMN